MLTRQTTLLCLLGLLLLGMALPAWSNDTEEQQHKARLNYQAQDTKFKPAYASPWLLRTESPADKKALTGPQGKTLGYYDNTVIAVDGAVVNSQGIQGFH